jgi:hypothetical protein
MEALEDRRVLAGVTVSTLNDVVDGNVASIATLMASPGPDGKISLREAIAAAAPSGDVIDFSVTGTINLTITGHTGQIEIAKALTINGPGAGLLTVAAFDPTPLSKNGDGNRVFSIIDVSSNGSVPQLVSISNLTLTGGDVGALTNDEGGAIRSAALLTLQHCTITNNSADRGGGVFVEVAGTGSRNVLTIEDCEFENNEAVNGGGIAIVSGISVPTSDVASITGTKIRNNHVSYGNGGGIFADLHGTSLTITESTIATNTSLVRGGGADVTVGDQGSLKIVDSFIDQNNQAPSAAGLFAFVDSSELEIRGSSISGNTASNRGGPSPGSRLPAPPRGASAF